MVKSCLVIDDDVIQRNFLSEFINETPELELKGNFESAIKALDYLEKNSVDLIFLDIEMPLLNGLEFLKLLKNKPAVILVSSEQKYALESYEYGVSDYLLKPLSYAKFYTAVQKIKVQFEQNTSATPSIKDLFVKVNSQIEKIDLATILFIEAAVDYIEIVTSTKKYLVNNSMTKIMEKLPQDQFARVHRSYIVQLNKIIAIDGNTLSIGNKAIPISKTYKEELLGQINLL